MFFRFVRQPFLGEGKLWIETSFTPLKIDLVLHSAHTERWARSIYFEMVLYTGTENVLAYKYIRISIIFLIIYYVIISQYFLNVCLKLSISEPNEWLLGGVRHQSFLGPNDYPDPSSSSLPSSMRADCMYFLTFSRPPSLSTTALDESSWRHTMFALSLHCANEYKFLLVGQRCPCVGVH